MALPTLQQFLDRPSPTANSPWHDQAWVKERGFKSLYMRKNIMWIEGKQLRKMLVIAQIHARNPGAGEFTKLLHRLHRDYNLYIQSVLSYQFELHLQKRGFKRCPMCMKNHPSYYLLIEDEIK